MNSHNQEYVDKFKKDITPWAKACKSIIVSYVAFKDIDGEFIIAKAGIALRLWINDLEAKEYNFENVRAGKFNLSDIDHSLDNFLTAITTGSFPTPYMTFVFKEGDTGRFSAYYDPFQNQSIKDGVNDGTYNFGTDPVSFEHIALDILPWIMWGTTVDDSSTFSERLDLNRDGLIAQINTVLDMYAEMLENLNEQDLLRTGLPPQYLN